MSSHLIGTLTEFSQSEKLHFIEEEWYQLMEQATPFSSEAVKPTPTISATLLLSIPLEDKVTCKGEELLTIKDVSHTFITAFSGVAQPVYQLRAFSMQ
jgi:hypothetical protein